MLKKALRSVYRFYRDVSFMIGEDIENDTRVSWPQRFKWYIKGFNSDRYYMYELDKNDYRNYLPDFYKHRTTLINGKHGVVLDDKKLFSIVMKGEEHQPEIYGCIQQGDIFDKEQQRDHRWFVDLVQQKEQIIVKRQSDGGGKGVYLLSFDETEFKVNNHVTGLEAFLESLDKKFDYILMEFIKQSHYASDIFPHTANTIRIQTMRDPENGQIFIPLAIHKFGTMASIPTDNQSRGGIFTGINIDTGELMRPCLYTNTDRLTYFDNHPDTGVRITGVKVPNWDKVKQDVIALAESLDYLPYIGWDIVVTDHGVKVVEGNNHTGIGLQMFQPLYADKRVRKFYKHHFERVK